jgi:hypothetical protein
MRQHEAKGNQKRPKPPELEHAATDITAKRCLPVVICSPKTGGTCWARERPRSSVSIGTHWVEDALVLAAD